MIRRWNWLWKKKKKEFAVTKIFKNV